MMGENPLLLVDASYIYQQGLPPTCYLVLDAHHAIPFVQQADPSLYVAPPWFDATFRLTQSAAGDNASGLSPAYRVEIWLYGRTIRYTFDVPQQRLGRRPSADPNYCCDRHQPTSDPNEWWAGLPYWGRLTEISDIAGHRIECIYCEPAQTQIGQTGDCRRCWQDSTGVGQLKAVKLHSPERVEWTLLYVHRTFGPCEDLYDHWASPRFFRAVHSINVYRRDASVPQQCPTISAQAICAATSIPEIESLQPTPPLPTDWEMRATYVYGDDLFPRWSEQAGCAGPVSLDPCEPNTRGSGPTSNACEPNAPPTCSRFRIAFRDEHMFLTGRLLKVVVEKRPQASATTLQRDVWMYRYKFCPSSEFTLRTELGAVFLPETVRTLTRAAELYNGGVCDDDGICGGSFPPPAPDDWENRLIQCFADATPFLHADTASGAGGTASAPFASLADIVIEPALDPCTPTIIEQAIEEHASWCGLSVNSAVSRASSSLYMHDNRSGRGHKTLVMVYNDFEGRGTNIVAGGSWALQDHVPVMAQASLLRYPFRVPIVIESLAILPPIYDDPNVNYWAFNRFDTPFWITVVDEINEDAVAPHGMTHALHSRRVIESNPAGFVLRDRTWEFEPDGAGTLVSKIGSAESRILDCSGRLIERRSIGWDTLVPGGSYEVYGLIQALAYEDQDCPPSGDPLRPCLCESLSTSGRHDKPRAQAVKRGANGNLYYRQAVERMVGREDLVTREVSFPSPAPSPVPSPGAGGYETETTYTFHPPVDGSEPNQAPVQSRTVRGPQTRIDSTGAMARSFVSTWYDNKGNQVLSLTGLAGDGWDGEDFADGTIIELFADRAVYDAYGRVTTQVRDANGPAGDPVVWQRKTRVAPAALADPNALAALNETTTFVYDALFGLIRTNYSNGRHTDIEYERDPCDASIYYQWVFKDVVEGVGGVTLLSPIQVTTIKGGRATGTIEIKSEAVGLYGPDPLYSAIDPNDIIATRAPQYDENGRVVGMSATGSDGQSLSASVFYNPSGGIARENGPEGTITRRVFDTRGRLERTYRGTCDRSDRWIPGYAPEPNDPNTAVCDNMALIEKRFFGEGVTDAGKVTQVRSYRNNLPGDDPGAADHRGSRTVHQYDWRMREVWVTRYDDPNDASAPGAVRGHTATWLDNLDRPRFVAEYEPAGGPGTVDPRAADPDADVPTAAQILATHPISLTETIYNGLGLPEEQRSYDVNEPNGGGYTATRTYYDHAGRPIETVSPGAPVRQYVYDAKGRQVLARSVAGGVAIEDTQTRYDENDRAVVTIRRERLHDASGAGLTPANSVATYAHNWYDKAGRLVASANYGTNAAGGFVPGGGEPAYDPNSIPASSPTVLVTRNQYDDAGRLLRVTQADGTVTKYEYDGLGRQTKVVENADSNGPERETRYVYDPNGRLERIDAKQSDGGLQQTRLTYDAPVIDRDGAIESYTRSWVSEVSYPDPLSGAPKALPDFTFVYYADGSVAQRKDARGVTHKHYYDGLGRRTRTDIDDSDWFATVPEALRPPDRIHRIDYTYSTDGLLLSAVASTNAGASYLVVADNRYDFSPGRRELTADWQQHFGLISAATPKTTYGWFFSSDAPGEPGGGLNVRRLATIAYPTPFGSPGRTVTLTCGTQAGDVDSRLNRITHISSTGMTGPLSTYAHCGLSRRVLTALGCGLAVSLGGAAAPAQGGYPPLDRFGRLLDLHHLYASGAFAGQTAQRFEYAYDLAGNRVQARLTQRPTADANWPGGWRPHANDRSYEYAFDELQRLIFAGHGQLDAAGQLVMSGSPWRTLDWSLDLLGNWSDPNSPPGQRQGLPPWVLVPTRSARRSMRSSAPFGWAEPTMCRSTRRLGTSTSMASTSGTSSTNSLGLVSCDHLRGYAAVVRAWSRS